MKEKRKKSVSNYEQLHVQLAESKLLLTEWKSCGFPSDSLSDNLSFELKDETEKKKLCLEAVDSLSKLTYGSMVDKQEESKYYLAVRSGDDLVFHETSLFSMIPKITTEGKRKNTVANMTRKEVIEELNTKFGSKRTQRQTLLKKQFMVTLTEKDAESIETLKNNEEAKSAETSVEEKEENTSDVLPPQNKEAVSVNEVYNRKDIISNEELSLITESIDFDSLELNSELLKKLVSKSNDNEKKAIAYYVDCLTLVSLLKYNDLRKREVLTSISNASIREMFLAKYTAVTGEGKNQRRVISDKNRDKILVHALILIFMLNNYSSIECDYVLSSFKAQKAKLSKVSALVGCYMETVRNVNAINTQVVVLRLPLNVLKEPNSKKRKYR